MVHQLVTQLGQGIVKMQPMNIDHIFLGNQPSKIATLSKRAAMAKKAALKGRTPGKAKANPARKAPQATKASAVAAAKKAARAKKVIFATPSPAGSARRADVRQPDGSSDVGLVALHRGHRFLSRAARRIGPVDVRVQRPRGGPSSEKNVATIQGHDINGATIPGIAFSPTARSRSPTPTASLWPTMSRGIRFPLAAPGCKCRSPLPSTTW